MDSRILPIQRDSKYLQRRNSLRLIHPRSIGESPLGNSRWHPTLLPSQGNSKYLYLDSSPPRCYPRSIGESQMGNSRWRPTFLPSQGDSKYFPIDSTRTEKEMNRTAHRKGRRA